MTIEDAIEHARRMATRLSEHKNCPCAKEHEQLGKWLEELRKLRTDEMMRGLKLAAEMCTEHTGGCDGCVFNNVAVWNGCMFRQKKYPARWNLNMED